MNEVTEKEIERNRDSASWISHINVLVLRHSIFVPQCSHVKIPPIKVYSNVSIKDLSTWKFSHCVELCPESIEVMLHLCLFVWYRGLFLDLTYLVITFVIWMLVVHLMPPLAPSFSIWFSLCAHFYTAFRNTTEKLRTAKLREYGAASCICESECRKHAKSEFNFEVKFYSRYIVVLSAS